LKRKKIDRKILKESSKYYILGLYNRFDEDHLWIMSASIAFNLIICSIPFTLIIVSIFGFYLGDQDVPAKINLYLNQVVGITPELRIKITDMLITALNQISKNSTMTAIIGVGGILWTTSGLFSTIRDVLNRIYRRRLLPSYIMGKLKDIGMVLLVTLMFLLSFATTFIISIAKKIDESYFENKYVDFGIFIEYVLPVLLGLLFTFIMFYVIYELVPHGDMDNKVVLVSSFSSTILYETLKNIFILYLVYFSNYQAVYGAYAAIVAIIFWLYYSSLTFVVGAEIGQLFQERKILNKK
jgi:membrane protein